MNKRMTIKKIMLWLYAMLLCLPLIQVGFRCGYVMFNKNAYESYYGETINQEIKTNINTIENLEIGKEYYFNNSIATTNLLTITGTRIYVSNFHNYIGDNTETVNNSANLVASLYFSNTGTSNAYIGIQKNDGIAVKNLSFNTNFSFYFTFEGITTENLDNIIKNDIYTVFYNNYSYLDNAFDYSLSEFIENNNTGLIDFVGLFSGMFLGNANAENSLYLGFANFMMNYALFVSCAYFVFEVLMWFINYARKWLYAFEEKGGAE